MQPRATLFSTIAVMLCAGPALAVPTITLTPATTPLVTRVDTNNVTYGCPARQAQTNSCIVEGKSQGIGYHDCIDDTKLEFSIAMTGVPDAGYQLQVWAGTGDCTQAGATNNASTGICWQVAAAPTMATVISPFYVRVANIVRFMNVSPPPQTFTDYDAVTACNTAKANSSTTTVTDDAGVSTSTAGEATVTIFFLVFPTGAGGTAPVANASYPVKVKLVGPNPVTNLAVGGGDGELVATWTPPSGDITVQGFDVYAAPSGSTTGITDASTTVCTDSSTPLLDDAGNPVVDDAGVPITVPDDAGCTTTGPTVNSCSGGTGTIDISGISCASSSSDGGAVNANGGICSQVNGPTNNKGTVTGLANGTDYSVAVAAFDQFGNDGIVSSAVCSTPKPINDFWTLYNQNGGNAFCALSVVGMRGGGIAAALIGLAGLIFVRRRRKA